MVENKGACYRIELLHGDSVVIIRAVILVLESAPIIGVSIIANYWIIGSMKF